MRPADTWIRLRTAGCHRRQPAGRWGETLLIRPRPAGGVEDPQAKPPVGKGRCHLTTAPIRAAASGSTRAVCRKVEDQLRRGEDKLTLIVSPTGFKHTGVFPEQAVNWAGTPKDPCRRPPGEGAEPLRLHRRATLACALPVLPSAMWMPPRASWHGQGQRRGKRPDRHGPSAGWWTTAPNSVAREKRRGNTYDGIIMDPPSYGRGPGGEIWKLEDCIYDLISSAKKCSAIPRCSLRSTATPPVCPRQSWSIMLKTRWCPALAARPAATRSVLPVSATAAWCPARHRDLGK